MRQFLHKLIGIFFWVVIVALWLLLVVEDRAGSANIAYSVQYVGAIAGVVLALTLWWIRHNLSIYRRKGARVGRPELAPRTDADRLGRPLRWQLGGGAIGALHVSHLVVELDGDAKVYREAG
jgi:hypothetical protein